MGNGELSDKEKWVRDFLDRERKVDVGKLGEMLYASGNERLREEFERLRRLTDLSVDEEKVWYDIQARMERGTRRGAWRYLKYAAVIMLPLCVGVLAWVLSSREKAKPVAVAEVLAPGKSSAYLLLSGGKRVDLSAVFKDTMLVEQGTNVRVDSAGRVAYVSAGDERAKEMVYNTIVVPRSGEYRLELADGTRVWLNSESELCYPVEFTGDRREVYLKGEGYFEVTRDTKKPFCVLVDDVEVRVLGTAFDVNAYRDRGSVVTTLVSGKVSVQDDEGKCLVEMKPGEQAEVRDGTVMTREVNARKAVAWVEGKFYFEAMPLEGIMDQLKRWYDIEVFFAAQDLKSYEFTGLIRRDFSAEQIFEIIEKTTRVKFNVKGRSVTVNYK